ncbi:hypothetical protein BKA65DRAFT_473980 [Rhexocercosporidium sp. MPI-PUGE-AT-0058]|nr:hypothetical protein BKA65DRAFT_473980 [Rhexocercosporidium sp. MPI-PUGE-AT-0058]
MPWRKSSDGSESKNISDQEEMPEMRSFQGSKYQQLGCFTSHRISTFSKAMAVVNLVLGMILAFSLCFVTHESRATCLQAANAYEPYSPALEAIVPTVKKFKPKLVFQSETSPEVEDACKSILGPSDGLVALDPETSAKLAQANH